MNIKNAFNSGLIFEIFYINIRNGRSSIGLLDLLNRTYVLDESYPKSNDCTFIFEELLDIEKMSLKDKLLLMIDNAISLGYKKEEIHVFIDGMSVLVNHFSVSGLKEFPLPFILNTKNGFLVTHLSLIPYFTANQFQSNIIEAPNFKHPLVQFGEICFDEKLLFMIEPNSNQTIILQLTVGTESVSDLKSRLFKR